MSKNTTPRGILLHSFELAAAREGMLSCVVRPVKPQPTNQPFWSGGFQTWIESRRAIDGHMYRVKCPFGPVGSVWYCKESWRAIEPETRRFGGRGALAHARMTVYANPPVQGESIIQYKADFEDGFCGFRPANHMKHWMARHWFKTESVSVKQFAELSGAEAKLAGAACRTDLSWRGTTEDWAYPEGFYGAGHIAGLKEELKHHYPDATDSTWCWVSTVTPQSHP